MKQTITLAAVLILFITMAASCGQSNKAKDEASVNDSTSQAPREAIELASREAIELAPLSPDDTVSACIIFSSDSQTVELIVPHEHIVLDRRVNGEGHAVWNVEDDDTYQVEQKDGRWQVSRRYTALYAQPVTE